MAPPKGVKVINRKQDFWLYSKTSGYDLTHPPTPDSPPITPRLLLKTSKEPIAIDPSKTALVVINMQNYFLSPQIGRDSESEGLQITAKLAEEVLPACRKAGIRVVWLKSGLTDWEIEKLPETKFRRHDEVHYIDTTSAYVGPGTNLGPVTLEDGTEIEAGRALLREQWNTELYAPLEEKVDPEDMHVYKNRNSGFWGCGSGGTKVEETLREKGIRTLLFSGVSTDDCVAFSPIDAFHGGWDCILLSDGCASRSSDSAIHMVELACKKSWGFVVDCKDLVEGVERMCESVVDAGQ